MTTDTSPYQYPPGNIPPQAPPQSKGLAVASMVIGIVAIVLSFIPVIGFISFILGPIAVILGIVAIVKKRGKGQAIAGIITGALGFIIVLIGTLLFGALVSSVDDEMQGLEELETEIESDAEAAGEEDAGIADIEEEVTQNEEEPPAGEWVEVATLSGTADQRGEVFTIENDARISYEFTATDEDFALAAIYLVKEGDVLTEDGGIPEAMLDGSESGETMVYQTGELYLDVAAANYDSWTVTVEEQQ